MVDQTCNRCGFAISLEKPDPYCCQCGGQDFTLTAESEEEKNEELFGGEKSVQHQPEPWRK